MSLHLLSTNVKTLTPNLTVAVTCLFHILKTKTYAELSNMNFFSTKVADTRVWVGSKLNLADIFKYLCLPLFLNILHVLVAARPYALFWRLLWWLICTAKPPPPQQHSSPHLMHRFASLSHVVWFFRRWIPVAITSDFSGKHIFFTLFCWVNIYFVQKKWWSISHNVCVSWQVRSTTLYFLE